MDVMAVLREFHRVNYTTQRMKLVVLSRHSLEELQTMVQVTMGACSFGCLAVTNLVGQESFSSLSVGDNTVQDLNEVTVSIPSTPLKDEALGALFRVQPVKRTHKLQLLWQLPPVLAKYRTRPHSIISHLLGHEGDGRYDTPTASTLLEFNVRRFPASLLT